MFALAGLGLAMASGSAALCSARELALRLQDLVAIIMVVLLLAIAAQVIVTRRDPTTRSIMACLGLSVAVGAGGFVLTSMIPILLAKTSWLDQSTVFLFFLVIYGGSAIAVSRYRLFDLAAWSFGILFYGFGVALLILLDAALLYELALDRTPAFGIALIAVGGIYLPLHDRLQLWMHQNRHLPAEELYRRVTEIAHSNGPHSQQAMLQSFWSDLFQPLAIAPIDSNAPNPQLLDNGQALTLPSVQGLPALRLAFADHGGRLFSSLDLARATTIQSMIDASLQQHRVYVDAITTERLRINRDMHDNIGVLLLGALHAREAERKDLLIRQTLTDLREIISNPDQMNWNLQQLVGNLRAEVLGHLEALDMPVTWQGGALPEVSLPRQFVPPLRSFLREGWQNEAYLDCRGYCKNPLLGVRTCGTRLSTSVDLNR